MKQYASWQGRKCFQFAFCCLEAYLIQCNLIYSVMYIKHKCIKNLPLESTNCHWMAYFKMNNFMLCNRTAMIKTLCLHREG